MKILTEPVGSIPRPDYLIEGMQAFDDHQITQKELSILYDMAIEDTIREFEATGSPVITDGEQTKPSFATYPVNGLSNLSWDGAIIPFSDGHYRQLPKLTSGPFRYHSYAAAYIEKAKKYTSLPVKQAVISASAMSLLYPQKGLEGYAREQFLNDLLNEAEADIRGCLSAGAYNVQIDFTEARLSLKLDPSGDLLKSFINLNNKVLERFTAAERQQIGVHSCPGGDNDCTHSADIDYSNLLPMLLQLKAGNFYLEYAGEHDKAAVLKSIKENMQPGQRIFLGVINTLDPDIETAEEVADLILEAASVIPVAQLGTTDDCGFSPFEDDVSTTRETAFAKIRARIEGTKLAEHRLSKSTITR